MLSIDTLTSNIIMQRALNQSTKKLSLSMQRLSSGLKINTCEDDAAGLSLSEKLSSNISSLGKVQQNTKDGIALLQTAEGGLKNILDILQRIKYLSVQASSNLWGEGSRNAMQQEAELLVDQIEQITKSTNFNGVNLFEKSVSKNTQTATIQSSPYISNYNKKITNIKHVPETKQTNNLSSIQTTSSTNSSRSGTIIFSSKDETKTLTLDGKHYTVINDSESSSTISYSYSADTKLLTVEGSNITITSADNQDNNIAIKGSQIKINGSNLADNITILSGSNHISVYTYSGHNEITVNADNCSVLPTGVNNKVTINGSGNRLETSPDTKKTDIIIFGNSNLIMNNKGDYSISSYGDSNIFILDGNSDKIEIIGSYNNIITAYNTTNKVTINGNQNSYNNVGSGATNFEITGDNNTINGGKGKDRFLINSGTNNRIDGGSGDRNTMINRGENTTYNNVVDITPPEPFVCDLQIGTKSDENSVISIEISFSLLDFEPDFSTANSSRNNIDTIDEMINNVITQLANIGGNINRLESVQKSHLIRIENLSSAQSTIQDADIAEETSNLVKNQILQQSATTLMMQSRMMSADLVLSLITGIQNSNNIYA